MPTGEPCKIASLTSMLSVSDTRKPSTIPELISMPWKYQKMRYNQQKNQDHASNAAVHISRLDDNPETTSKLTNLTNTGKIIIAMVSSLQALYHFRYPHRSNLVMTCH